MTPFVLLAVAVLRPPLPAGVVAVNGVPRLAGGPVAFSPDGDWLLRVDGQRVVRVAVAGGPPEALGKAGPPAFGHSAAPPVWPADGVPSWLATDPTGFTCLTAPPDARPAPTGNPLAAAVLSPDAKTVLAVWQSANGVRAALYPFVPGKRSHELTELRPLAGPVPLNFGSAARFTHDSSHVLADLGPLGLVGYAVATGKEAWRLGGPDARPGRFLGFDSADGRRVAAVRTSPESGVRAEVWDARTGHTLCDLDPGPTGLSGATAVAVTPDGKQAVVLSRTADGRLGGALADAITGKLVRTLAPQPCGPAGWRLAVSPDGRRLAAATHDAGAVWDLTTGKDARPAGGHRGPVTTVLFTPDGKWVVSGGGDHTVRCWSAETGAERWAVAVPDGATPAGLTPDGSAVLVNAGQQRRPPAAGLPLAIRVADGKPLPMPATLADPTHELAAFSSDGRTLAAVAATEFRLFTWPAGAAVRTIPFAGPVRKVTYPGMSQVRFAADGTELVGVAAFDRPPGFTGPDAPHRVERYEVATGKLLSAVDVASAPPLLLPAFGRLAFLAARMADPGETTVFAATDGSPVGQLGATGRRPRGGWEVPRAAARADGRRLLLAAGDVVHVFDPADGLYRGAWPPVGAPATAVAFSPDGSRLVTGDATGVCVVWDADRGMP